MLELKYLSLLYGAINGQSGDGNFDRITDGKILSLARARQTSPWAFSGDSGKIFGEIGLGFFSFVCVYIMVIDFKYWFYWYFETINWSIFNIFISFPMSFVIYSKKQNNF